MELSKTTIELTGEEYRDLELTGPMMFSRSRAGAGR